MNRSAFTPGNLCLEMAWKPLWTTMLLCENIICGKVRNFLALLKLFEVFYVDS